MARALVISNHSRLRGIVADKCSGAIRPAAIRLDALLNRPRGNEACFLLKQVRGECAPRCDVVDDPDAATVRPKDEVILAWLDRKIAHSDRRKAAAFELRPGFATVNGDKQAKLSAEK